MKDIGGNRAIDLQSRTSQHVKTQLGFECAYHISCNQEHVRPFQTTVSIETAYSTIKDRSTFHEQQTALIMRMLQTSTGQLFKTAVGIEFAHAAMAVLLPDAFKLKCAHRYSRASGRLLAYCAVRLQVPAVSFSVYQMTVSYPNLRPPWQVTGSVSATAPGVDTPGTVKKAIFLCKSQLLSIATHVQTEIDKTAQAGIADSSLTKNQAYLVLKTRSREQCSTMCTSQRHKPPHHHATPLFLHTYCCMAGSIR